MKILVDKIFPFVDLVHVRTTYIAKNKVDFRNKFAM